MNLKNLTFSGVKWTTISTFFLALFGLIKLSVFTRFLDPSDFGLMAIISVILGFMSLFMDMGFTSAILYQKDISKKEYSSLYWLNVIFSFLLCFILFSVRTSVSQFYQEQELSNLIALSSLVIIISAIGKQFKTIEQKYFNFKYIAITDTIGGLLGLFVGVTSAMKGFQVYSLVYAVLAQHLISNGIYVIVGVYNRGLLFHLKLNEALPFLKIGVYHVGGQVLNYFNRDFDILIIGKFFGSDILGGYSLAKQLVQYPMQILNPIISRVASPILAALQNKEVLLKEKFLYFLNIVSTSNFIAYTLLVLFSNLIVNLLYGSNFSHILILVWILSLYMYLRSIASIVGSLVIAKGKTYLEFFWNILVFFITPLAIYIGVHFSIEMVALALVIVTVILIYPFWKFLIYKLCKSTLFEFLINYIPNFKNLYYLILQKENKNAN